MSKLIDDISKIDRRVTKLCQNFEGYLKFLGMNNPFAHTLWENHRNTIKLRHEIETVEEAIESDEFLKSLRITLTSWGTERAGLITPDEFKSQFRLDRNKERIISLGDKHVTHLNSPTSSIVGVNLREALLLTIHGLGLSVSKRQVVTGSKALHHLLPAMLPPIDAEYTGRFFSINKTKTAPVVEYPSMTLDILNGFAMIGQCLQETKGKDYLSKLVGKTGYSTTEAKLIDNAIIGYVIKCKLKKK